MSLRSKLLSELRDYRFRRAFVEGQATDTIAFQLRAMRKQKDWEQKDVAAAMGNPKLQPMISRYENPDYGKYSVSTLLQLAEVFDVGLVVRFAPFSELIRWDATLAPEKINVKSFDAEFESTTETTESGWAQVIGGAAQQASTPSITTNLGTIASGVLQGKGMQSETIGGGVGKSGLAFQSAGA